MAETKFDNIGDIVASEAHVDAALRALPKDIFFWINKEPVGGYATRARDIKDRIFIYKKSSNPSQNPVIGLHIQFRAKNVICHGVRTDFRYKGIDYAIVHYQIMESYEDKLPRIP